jgi:hypothetical protein
MCQIEKFVREISGECIASNFGFSIKILSFLSCIVLLRACPVPRFNIYYVGNDLIFIKSRTFKA